VSDQIGLFDGLKPKSGRELRDEGIRKALSNQETWKDRYRILVVRWFDSLPAGATFNGEDLRRAALGSGIDQPRHHNSWSAGASGVLRLWMRDGRVTEAGMTQALRPSRHANLIRLYRKVR
jgi:hypothetical protein